MGKHAEWRKLSKKLRRKRIRSIKAIARDKKLIEEQKKRENSPTYQLWLKEQTILEEFNAFETKRLAMERQKVWETAEELALLRWREQQSRLAQAKAEKFKKEMIIKEEWEREQRKLQEAEEVRKKNEDEKKRKQAELLAQIDAFIEGRADLPEEVNVSTQTQPGHPDCPFFSKTGACRFKDSCSRNHTRPGVSRTLLVPNFYDHFGLQALHQDEYDTDLSLEYEDSETYQHFKEFYKDVLPEFEQCGRVTQFKVCNNEEPHLRGNVYVEFFSRRHALKAYRTFQGRFYAGRRLNVEFANIPSWKNAICGLFHRQKCPKGKTCNFLHVFRNPDNAFRIQDGHSSSRRQFSRSRSRSPIRRRSRSKEWNWSEGSDSDNESRRRRSRSHSKSRARTKNRDSEMDTDRRRSRSRSRSPTRVRSKTRDTSRDRRNKRLKDRRRDDKYQSVSRSPKRDKKRHKDDSRDEFTKKSKKDRNDDLRSEKESNGREDTSKRSRNDDSRSEKESSSREDSNKRSKKSKDEDKNRSKEKSYKNEPTKKHEKDDSNKKYEKDYSTKKQKDKSDEIEKKDKKSKKDNTEESDSILKHKSDLDSKDKGPINKSVSTPNKKSVNGDL